MKKLLLCITALTMLVTGARAQDISGNWQGTLKAGKDLRLIFNLYKGDKDAWSANMYSIDQTPQPIPVDSVAKQGSNIKIAVGLIGGTFEGKLSDDNKTMTGTWSQGGQSSFAAHPGKGDAGDGVGDSNASCSGKADGGRCESILRCGDDQAESLRRGKDAGPDHERAQFQGS